MNSGTPWTDDEVLQLRALVAEHTLTYVEIAAVMRRPKSSVLGKVFRLKLRPPPAARATRARGPDGKWLTDAAVPVAATEAPQRPTEARWTPPVRVFPPVRTCQWPTSSGRPWMFCEATPVVPGRAYCLEHCRQAFHRPPRQGGDTVNWAPRYGG